MARTGNDLSKFSSLSRRFHVPLGVVKDPRQYLSDPALVSDAKSPNVGHRNICFYADFGLLGQNSLSSNGFAY